MIKSNCTLCFFFACLLYSSHRLCVLSSDYSAKPCLIKDHQNLSVLFFFRHSFVFLYLHHTHTYAWLSHIIFYLFVFYTNIFFFFLSACIFLLFVYFEFLFLYECLAFFFFSCVPPFSFDNKKKTARRTIDRYSRFFCLSLPMWYCVWLVT